MNPSIPNLGLGIGWRPELALAIDRHPDLGFVEVIAEDIDPSVPLPPSIERLRRRGIPVIPHGLTLSLGGAERVDAGRVRRLGNVAKRLGSRLVSEHLSFVRAGGKEAGHLLPLPRTREMLDIVVENVRQASAHLPAPFALENIASLFEWPHAEMDEATFLAEVLERADVGLLLDIENVYANARNHRYDAVRFLDRLPLHRIAYVHIAGGVERNGLYHDSHADPVPNEVLDLLEELCARVRVPGVMLERDENLPDDTILYAELDAIAAAARRGDVRREKRHVLV